MLAGHLHPAGTMHDSAFRDLEKSGWESAVAEAVPSTVSAASTRKSPVMPRGGKP